MADITGGQDSGKLIGQNPLEEAAKDFNAAIDKLSNIYNEKVKPAAGAAQSMWTGKPSTFTRQGNGQNGGGATFGGRSVTEQAQSYTDWRSTASARQNRAPFNQLTSNLYGFAGPSFPAPTMPNGGGPSVPGPRSSGQVAPGQNNGGGSNALHTAGKAAGLGASFKALANYGNRQLQTQLPMDQYVYQGTLGMGGNLQQNQAALRRQAFGQNNQNLNAIANGSADAAAMYSELGQVAGTPLLGSSQTGRTINRSASLTGVLNPYMSGAQNAQVQSNIYSPTTSMGAMRMGLMTPRQAGSGNARDLSRLSDSWMKSFFGGRNPSLKEINAAFAEGGKANISLTQGMGLSQSSIQSVANIARAQAQVRARGGDWNAAEKLIDKARQGDTKAGEELQSKYGLDKSLVQSLKNKQAAKTGRDADTSAAFNKALSDATDTLQKFSKALTAVMNKTGITSALGTGGAWASQLSGSLGGFGGAVQGIGGLYGTYAIGKMLAGKGGISGGGLTGAAEGAAGGRLSGLAGAARTATGVGAGGGLMGAARSAGVIGVGIDAAYSVGHTALTEQGRKAAARRGGQWENAFRKLQGGKDSIGSRALSWLLGSQQEITNTATGGYADKIMNGTANKLRDWFGMNDRHSDDGQSGGADNTTNRSERAGSKGKRATGNATGTKVVQEAEKYLGRPYHYGGNSPKTNFDCSGLTQWSFKEAGMNIPRVAKDQQSAGKEVPKNQLRAGDLIFKGNPAHHVALMIDNKTLIEAPHTGATIRKRKYTPGEWTDARRLIGMVGDLKGGGKGRGDTSNSLGERAGDSGSGDTGDSGSYGSSSELTNLQGKLAGGPQLPSNRAYSGVAAYATGTKGAKGGVILTGERGAELVHTDDNGKTSVWNAKQTIDMLSGNNDRPMHDMLMGAGLATARKSGTGNVVNLNFGDNAIVIKSDTQVANTQNSTTSKQVQSDIKRETMLDAIASGKKN